jgi:putative protease
MQPRVEVLAPAGDEPSIDAAIRAGADAVYFGLANGFNARARAENVELERLPDVMRRIHESGRRGYLTLNTLIFDHELERLEGLMGRIGAASVDAVIVQDLGVARWIKRFLPTLRLHASTQMTCTDASAVRYAESLGASRVTLARELSLEDIRELRQRTAVELEIFAHGALCIAYSGQCLTSEAIGGRSANRGACAQACRLPYELVVDGVLRDLGDVAYLLSPTDLNACERIPELLALGVSAVKIEGRLKGPEYVAATTLLYRKAIDAALGLGLGPSQVNAEAATQAFSRGASTGFLDGTDHQRLVDGRTCDHVGVEVGQCFDVSRAYGKSWLRCSTTVPLSRGDGILVEGGRAGKGEIGGRIWALRVDDTDAERVESGEDVWLWLGPDKELPVFTAKRRVFRTSSPRVARLIETELAERPNKLELSARLSGAIGAAPILELTASDGRTARVTLDGVVEKATARPLTRDMAFEKLARLGDTPYLLRELELQIESGGTLSLSALNRGRREAVEHLAGAVTQGHVPHATEGVLSNVGYPTFEPPPPGLFVTCRNLEQAEASIRAGAQGVYLDFLALTGVGPALRALRDGLGRDVTLGVALPRIRKVGEDKIDRYVWELEPDVIVVRSLGSLFDASARALAESTRGRTPMVLADFSLNVANSLTAVEVLSRGASAFTPSYDMDAAQLTSLLDSPLAPYAEVVIYHPMPLFHMEHCVIAALLSEGKDHRDCGRPCERHQVNLRDRTGLELPVEADIGCRNTVFHGKAQSAAEQLRILQTMGMRRFRLELVRQTATETEVVVRAHRELIDGNCAPVQLRQRLKEVGLSVVSGSLRVVG